MLTISINISTLVIFNRDLILKYFSAFGAAATNGKTESQSNGIDEQVKQQILAEEEAAINQFKVIMSLCLIVYQFHVTYVETQVIEIWCN